MQLNTDLKAMLTELGSVILSTGIKEVYTDIIKVDSPIIISIKTPNFFYRSPKLFLESPEEVIDITPHFNEEALLKVRNCMGQAYFNYFFHYNKEFTSKFYSINYSLNNTSSIKLIPEEALETN